MCVQRFDDSRNSAIHITYRISLRSSSMPEPRDPLLKVLTIRHDAQTTAVLHSGSDIPPAGAGPDVKARAAGVSDRGCDRAPGGPAEATEVG